MARLLYSNMRQTVRGEARVMSLSSKTETTVDYLSSWRYGMVG